MTGAITIRNFQYLLLAALLATPGSSVLAATYFVSPDGSDGSPGTEAAPWRTIDKANQTLLDGDTVQLKAGTYNDSIRPMRSGASDDRRIVYRAFGNGPVLLNTVGDLGGNPEAEGAIALGGRRFVTVNGGLDRWIRVRPTVNYSALGNVTNSRDCVVDGVVLDGSQSPGGGGNLFLFNYLYSPEETESSHNVLRNSLLRGRTLSFSVYSEDLIQVAGNAHHNVIENNVLRETFHVVVNVGQGAKAVEPYANVIRDNLVINRFHTALSFYPAGERNLVEGNTLVASGGKPSTLAGPGNALQYATTSGIVRYNLIAYGGATDSQVSVGGIGLSTGGDAPADSVGNRFYNNTIVKNDGAGLGVFYWENPGSLGDNQFVNNIFYGNNQHPSASFPGISVQYEGTQFVPGGVGDQFVANLIGNPNGNDPAPDPSADVIFDAILGGITAAEAETLLEGPEQPLFLSIEQLDPGFVDYLRNDFRLAPTSPLIDRGHPLTRVASSDTGSGAILRVEDARFFQAAEGFEPWMDVVADQIAIGPDRTDIGSALVVGIEAVDETNDTVVLAAPVNRSPGDAIWLWSDSRSRERVDGGGPDFGAFEHE